LKICCTASFDFGLWWRPAGNFEDHGVVVRFSFTPSSLFGVMIRTPDNLIVRGLPWPYFFPFLAAGLFLPAAGFFAAGFAAAFPVPLPSWGGRAPEQSIQTCGASDGWTVSGIECADIKRAGRISKKKYRKKKKRGYNSGFCTEFFRIKLNY